MCLLLSISYATIGNLSMSRNPNLGFATKVRGCKVTSQERDPRVTSHAPGSAKECEGMNPHTPK
jgi:hypothetical protein